MGKLKTSQEWWDSIKNDGTKLLEWLKKQYHGEVTAAQRIREVFGRFELTEQEARMIEHIASEEELHAKWIGQLLENRGVSPKQLVKQERYWDETLPQIKCKESAAAVAHHAEHMRLERIRVIVNDLDAPDDIWKVFCAILPMEIRHDKWFASLSDEETIKFTKSFHDIGKKAIGLEA